MKSKIIIAFISLLLLSCNSQKSDERGSDKPNIIYILADDLGYVTDKKR